MQVNGLMPTEFDPTTNRVLRTLAAIGVANDELGEDAEFLTELFQQVSHHDLSILPPGYTIEVMDLTYIGLIYHRHMPFKDEHSNKVAQPERAENDYIFTLNAVSNGLVRDLSLDREVVREVGAEGARFVHKHMKDADQYDEADEGLHTQFLALGAIGMLVHRLVPTTNKNPAH